MTLMLMLAYVYKNMYANEISALLAQSECNIVMQRTHNFSYNLEQNFLSCAN